MSVASGRESVRPRVGGPTAASRSRNPRSTTFTVYVLWFLVVLGTQPWSASESSPQGATASSGSTAKGALLIVCFFIALLLSPRGLRLRVPATSTLYFVYVAVALCASLLLADPLAPATRILRIVLALLIPLLLWDVLRRDVTLLLRAHLAANAVLALSIAVGPLISPAKAWANGSSFASGGRLEGVIIPVLPPGVGAIGALVAGLAVVMWSFRRLPWWMALPLMMLGSGLVFASRTRTAAGALVVGVLVAALVAARSRGGRTLFFGLAAAALPLLVMSEAAAAWLLRGQTAERFSSLSGRTLAWDYIIQANLAPQTVLLGHGLGNRKVLLTRGQGDVNVVPIDNSWLGLYWETGILGALVVLAAVFATAIAVLRAPTPFVRAATAFLVVFVVVASFNESGLSDVSTLTLALLVAATVADLDRFVQRRESAVLPGKHAPNKIAIP